MQLDKLQFKSGFLKTALLHSFFIIKPAEILKQESMCLCYCAFLHSQISVFISDMYCQELNTEHTHTHIVALIQCPGSNCALKMLTLNVGFQEILAKAYYLKSHHISQISPSQASKITAITHTDQSCMH